MHFPDNPPLLVLLALKSNSILLIILMEQHIAGVILVCAGSPIKIRNPFPGVLKSHYNVKYVFFVKTQLNHNKVEVGFTTLWVLNLSHQNPPTHPAKICVVVVQVSSKQRTQQQINKYKSYNYKTKIENDQHRK